jgi:hypothetical protein
MKALKGQDETHVIKTWKSVSGGKLNERQKPRGYKVQAL